MLYSSLCNDLQTELCSKTFFWLDDFLVLTGEPFCGNLSVECGRGRETCVHMSLCYVIIYV